MQNLAAVHILVKIDFCNIFPMSYLSRMMERLYNIKDYFV